MNPTRRKGKGKGKRRRRVNRRMLMIVGLSIIIVGGMGFGLVWLQVRGSVSRNISAGHAMLTEGNHRAAAAHFGRVLHREPTNQEAHEGRITAILNTVPDTPQNATKYYREYLSALAHHALFTPGDEEKALLTLDELHFAAVNSDEEFFWQFLGAQGEEMLVSFQPGTPVYNQATLMSGLSKLRLGQSNLLGDVDQAGLVRFPGEAELRSFIELEPTDDEGLAHLAFGRMAVARRLGLKELFQQEERNLALAQETYDRALEANPEGPETLLAVVRHQYIHELLTTVREESRRRGNEVESALAALEERLDLAERVILAQADPERAHIFDLATYLRLVDLDEGRARAANVMRTWIEKNPDDLHAQCTLADDLRELGDVDESRALVEAVLAEPDYPVSFESYRQQRNRLVAAVLVFESIDRQRAAAGEHGDETGELDAALQAARDNVVEIAGGAVDDPMIAQLDGRIAFRRGAFNQATTHFEHANKLDSSILSAESLRQAAVALERIGQQGVAIRRLEQAIRREPRRLYNRLLLAGLLGRMRHPEQALAVLERIPERIKIENPDVSVLEESLHAMLATGNSPTGELRDVRDPILRAIAQADRASLLGKHEEAYAGLEALSLEHTADVRLLVAMAFLEAKMDRVEDARAHLDEALAIDPENRKLKDLRLQLSSEDPIKRLDGLVTDQYPPGEEREIGRYVGLHIIAANYERRADVASQDGREEDAVEARATAERAREAAAGLEVDIDAHATTSGSAFGYAFERHLSTGNFDKAEQLLVPARASDLDGAQGNLAEARLYLALGAKAASDGDAAAAMEYYERATASARRATELTPWRSATWQALSAASQQRGDLSEARIALQELLERSPGDLAATRQLAAMHLMDGGDPSRAVELLSEASRRQPAKEDLRETWLQVEAAHGSPRIVMGHRHRRWIDAPDDRRNALWYAGLMASLEPDFTLVLDERGRPSVSGRAWLGFNSVQQREVLDQLQATWLDRIETILADLEGVEHDSLRDSILHATVQREAGQRAQMVRTLEQHLETRVGSAELPLEVIQSAQFLARSDRVWEATALLEQYLEHQSPELREIDTALGTLHHASGKCEDALPYLRGITNERSLREARLRIIDCLLQLNRLDEAEDVLAELQSATSDDYDVALLSAALARYRGQAAEAQGNAQVAREARAAFRAALEEASRINPSKARPYADLIESLVLEYRSTLDRAILEEALRYSEAAESILSDSDELVVQRANVHEAMGNPRQGVLDLEAFLRKHPRSREVRSRLASAYGAAGTPLRAIDTIEQAIAASPRDPYWHGMLGDHLRMTGGDLERASRTYITAWEIEPTRARLMALAEATRTTRPWDYEALVKAVEQRPAELTIEPTLRGLLARAEAGLGMAGRARETLREAYHQYRTMLERGEIPPTVFNGWYEDLYVLYPDGEVVPVLEFVDQTVGDSPTIYDRRGLARFHALRGTPEDLAEAIRIQQEVLRTLPTEQQIHDLGLLGSYQLRAEQNAQAAETFKAVVDLQPNDPIALNNYAFLVATYLDGADVAEPHAIRAVELRPSEPSFLDTLASVQDMLNKHAEATTTRLSQLRIQPNNVDLLVDIAHGYGDRLDRPAEGLTYAEQALKLRPRDARTLDMAGWLAWRTGKETKGRDRVAQSLRRQPTAEAHLHMARIMAAAGQADEARNHLQQAANLANDEALREAIQEARADLDGNT